MKPSKIVKVFATIMIVSVCLTALVMTGPSDEVDDAFLAYNRSTQDFNKTSVETVIKQLEKETVEPSINNPSNNNAEDVNIPGIGHSTQSWLNICDKAHKEYGAAGFSYVLGGQGTLTKNGREISVRLDCSGYVGYCIYSAGWSNTATPITSGSDLTPYGFTKITDGTLVPGDVVAWSGHIEVYVSGEKTVLNWGGASSAQGRYTGVSDINSVDSTSTSGHTFPPTTVWRPNVSSISTGTPESNTSEFTAENSASGLSKVIFLDAGHGCNYNSRSSAGSNGWASIGNGDGIGEAVFTAQLAAKVESKLESNGYTVLTVEECGGSRAEYGNSGRGKLFNQSNASIMIQLHWDGNDNRSVNGWSVLLCHGTNKPDLHNTEGYLATCIRPYYSSTGISEFSSYFTKVRTDLGLSAVVTKPTILIETGFGSNDSDRAILESTEGQNAIADAILKGLNDFYGGN